MAKASGNTLDIARQFMNAAEEAGSYIDGYAEGILDIADQIINEGSYSDEEGLEYDLISESATSIKFGYKESDSGQGEDFSTSRSLSITGENLDQENSNAEVKGISFADKNSFSSKQSGSSSSQQESSSGKASVSYRPFAGEQEGLNQSIDLFSISENDSTKRSFSFSEGSSKFSSKFSEKSSFSFKGDLNSNNGDLSGTINSLSLSLEAQSNSKGSEEGEDGEQSSSASIALTSKNGIMLGEDGATGIIDTLSLAVESDGFWMNKRSLGESSEISYEGSNINARVLNGSIGEDDEMLVASMLFAGDDTLSGDSNSNQIFGFAGKDTYSWNIAQDGEDAVNLSRLVPELELEGAEEIDTVAVSGAGKAAQMRISFVSAEIGNGNVNDSNDDGAGNEFGNEDGGLAVRLQLETAGVPSGTIGRFDDEGMLFTTKSGTFDVRDLNSGAARGDQFKTVFLGTGAMDVQTGAATADYLNGGMGNDFLNGGKGNDFLVGGIGNDFLTGGKGNDTYIGGTGNDTIITNKGDSGLKVVKDVLQADIVTGFSSADDALSFDVKVGGYSEAGAAVANYAAALAAANAALAEMGKTEDKSALFNFQFTATNGYLFEDYTGDGKVDQVIVLAAINNMGIDGSDVIGLLGTSGAPINEAA
ncbi:MAG: hypothetical protein AABY68_06435 [Pseudomonadota bacterium]